MTAIPEHFFINGKLHKKLAVIRSDSVVLAFCYQDEKPHRLPLVETRRNFRKAYTIQKAAALMKVKAGRLKEIFDSGLYKKPERSYDLATYAPSTAYISESDMLEIRQVAYDLLPKNKYGIPSKDTMASREDLIQAMRLTDERDFVTVEGDYVRIFRA